MDAEQVVERGRQVAATFVQLAEEVERAQREEALMRELYLGAVAENERLRAENEQMLQRHADEVMTLDRVHALIESDRDVDGNVGTVARWSTADIERLLDG